jgi:ribonuclease P protein component
MSAKRPHRLRPAQRIKRGRDFMRARAEGRRVVQGCLILNWTDSPPGRTSRVGVITSRKLGGAVVRSRARRLLREAFRLNQDALARMSDLVLIARNSIVGKDLGGVQTDFLTAARRAQLLAPPADKTP